MKESEDTRFSKEDFLKQLKDVFSKDSITLPGKRWLYAGFRYIKSIHKESGDERFFELINQFNIRTTRTGAKYIKDFLKKYEQNKNDERTNT